MSHRCRMLTGPNPRAPATDIESRKPTVLYCCVPRGTSWIYRIYLSDLTAVKLNGSHPDGTNQEYARAYVKVPRPVEYSHPSPVGSPPPRPPPLHIYIYPSSPVPHQHRQSPKFQLYPFSLSPSHSS